MNIEYFQNAPEVILIRNKSLPGRAEDAHILENRLFDDVRVMRADKQAGIDVITQIQIRKFGADKRLAEVSC